MEITTTMGMVGTMGVPTRDFRHVALRSMIERETLLVEEFYLSNEMERLENEFWNHKMVGAHHAAYTDRFHELAKLVPHLVTPELACIKRYVAGLAPEIRGMLKATQATTIQNAILRADNSDRLKDTRAPPISCGNHCQRVMRRGRWFEYRARAGQAGNPLVLKGNRNNRNNGNQTRGRAYNVNVNAAKASRDPKVVTGTFSLNNSFTTVLFDSGADFSFISSEFMSLLNVKPSIANPSYVIEIADGKKVEVDRIIRGCKLELVNSLFTIDLILLGA
ncbi:reverse transcriptase domain-containing protein [Tanacetum coccineum]